MAAIELDLLAAMLDQGDVGPIQNGAVEPRHFLSNEGQTLYTFIKDYKKFSEGTSSIPNRAIIQERFGGSLLLPDTLGNEDLNALSHEVRLAYRRTQLQQLAVVADEAANLADPIEALPQIQGLLDTIHSADAGSDDLVFTDALDDIIDDYASGNILPMGSPWPWPSINDPTRGMHNGEFYVVAGRPKARKTFVALYIVCFAALKFGTRVLIVTPEMPVKQIMLRVTATMAALRYSNFKSSTLSEDELQQLIDLRQSLISVTSPDKKDQVVTLPNGGQIVITKGTGKGVAYIQSKVEKYRINLTLVDSFYRCTADTKAAKSDADWKVVTAVSRGLKDMAMETDSIVIGTHQLNRDAEQGVGSLSNLSLADAVGQDADLIMRVITAKRKHGPDKTALILLGARETNVEGVLIRNNPCCDYSEIEVIEDPKKTFRMLTEEDEDLAAENAQNRKKAEKPARITAQERKKAGKTLARIPDPIDIQIER